jgi:hypothetical protein
MPVKQRISYDTTFLQNVQGQLLARFRLDAAGNPMYRPHSEDRHLRVYTIDLFLESSLADKIDRVDYFLNDTTFIDPKGSSTNKANRFQKEIASYGDVEVVVTVHMGEKTYEQRIWLSQMLENGHTADMTGPISEALNRIRAY